MPSIDALITAIVVPLIAHPEEFGIEIVETPEFTEYHLKLNPSDVGKVIGKKGRVARAIRTIVYGVNVQGQKRARLVIPNNGLQELEA